MQGKIGSVMEFAGTHRRAMILTAAAAAVAAGGIFFIWRWKGASSQSEVSYREYTVQSGDVTVGTTESGTVSLSAENVTFPIAVQLSELAVKSGQTVKKGDALVRLNLSSVADNSSDARQKMASAKSDLEQALIDQEAKLSTAQVTYESSKYLAEAAPVTRNLTEQSVQNEIETAQQTLKTDQTGLAKYQKLRKSWSADDQKLQELQKWRKEAEKNKTSCENQLSSFNDDNERVLDQYESLEKAKESAYSEYLTAKYRDDDYDEEYDAYKDARDALEDYASDTAGKIVSQQTALEDKVAQYTAEYKNYAEAYDDFKETYDKTYDLTGTELDNKVTALQSAVKTDQYNLKKAQGTAKLSSYDAQVQEQTDLGTANTAQETYDLTVRKLAQEVETQQQTYDKLKRQIDEIDGALNGDGVLTSPCDGTVTGISYSGGDSVAAGETILSVYSDSSVSLAISVSEDDITDVEVGQLADISLSAYEGQTLPAVVESVTASPARSGSSSVSYTVAVKTTGDVSLPGKVYEGMSGEATLIQKSVSNVLYVSNRAISFSNGVSTVKVRGGSGKITDKTIQTGFSDGTYAEITKGLEKGDTVLAESAVSGA